MEHPNRAQNARPKPTAAEALTYERKYFIRATSAKTRATMTSSQTSATPLIIQLIPPVPSIMTVSVTRYFDLPRGVTFVQMTLRCLTDTDCALNWSSSLLPVVGARQAGTIGAVAVASFVRVTARNAS